MPANLSNALEDLVHAPRNDATGLMPEKGMVGATATHRMGFPGTSKTLLDRVYGCPAGFRAIPSWCLRVR